MSVVLYTPEYHCLCNCASLYEGMYTRIGTATRILRFLATRIKERLVKVMVELWLPPNQAFLYYREVIKNCALHEKSSKKKLSHTFLTVTKIGVHESSWLDRREGKLLCQSRNVWLGSTVAEKHENTKTNRLVCILMFATRIVISSQRQVKPLDCTTTLPFCPQTP